MEKELKLIGIISKDGFEIDNRVYSRGGCNPTLKAGNARVHVIRRRKNEKKENQNHRRY